VPPLRAPAASAITLTRPSFSRSYGCILPSSLTRVISIALVFSTYPPELVWGTGTHVNSPLSFSRQHRITDFAWIGSVSRLRRHGVRICLDPALHAYPGTTIAPDQLPSCVPLRLSASRWVGSQPAEAGGSPLATRDWNGRARGGTGISTGCASATPLGLALAPDLPWED
jgi:hypothetical protein